MKLISSQFQVLSLLWIGMASLPQPLLGHDVPERVFDRGIEVTLQAQRVHVTYHLSVSHLTLAQELLSLAGAGGVSGMGPDARMGLYGTSMGPLLARGMLLHVDGMPIDLEFQSASHKLDDHPRFQFEFSAGVGGDESGHHELRLEDTNFFLEKGLERIAIHAESPCELEHASVPEKLDLVTTRSAWEMTPEQQDAARRATARWKGTEELVGGTTAAGTGPRSQQGAAAGRAGRIQDLTALLDHWSDEFFVVLLGLAFFFGAAHAMTPGHGKTMVAAYLVGERGTMRHAVGLGLTTSFTHTSSVLVVALLLWLLGPTVQEKLNVGYSLVSGLLVAGLGAALLVTRLRTPLRHASCKHPATASAAACSSASPVATEPTVPGPGWSGLITLGVSGGIVPCPDAIVLLLIATAQGQVERAVYLLLSFSAGLASALVLVGILAVKLRGFLASRLGSGRFVQSLPVLSAATILAVGVYLCFTTLHQPAGIGSLITPAATRTARP